MGIKWIIKTFQNVYLQDDYHFKDLNIQKRGLIFRIWIKNMSKAILGSRNLKKGIQIGLNSNTGSAPKRAIWHSWDADWHFRHFPSADWHKNLARPEDSWIEISPIFFDFLEIMTRLNSYLIIQLIFRSFPTSINRGCLSKFSTSDPPLSGSSFLIFQFPLR